MLAYPINLEEDGYDLVATSPDFPELTIVGDDREETIARAVHAMEEVIATRIHDHKDIPSPSRGETYVTLPTLASVKVMLYQEMREQGISKTELCRRLGWQLQQLDRVLDLQHGSHLDKVDAALGAIGRKLYVTAAATSDLVVAPAPQENEAVSAM